MRSGLGHHVDWYMGVNVLEEHSGSVFKGSWKMEVICPVRTPSFHQSDYTVA
jgi:hypothetical protein